MRQTNEAARRAADTRGHRPDATRDSNLHEDLARADEIIGPSERKFGLTIGAVCSLIGGVRLYYGHRYSLWVIGGGVVLAALGVLWPAALAPLNRLWAQLGLVLYKIVNPVVMTLLFLSTMVPIGLMMQLCGNDSLRLKRNADAKSYWILREPPGPSPETMRNQF